MDHKVIANDIRKNDDHLIVISESMTNTFRNTNKPVIRVIVSEFDAESGHSNIIEIVEVDSIKNLSIAYGCVLQANRLNLPYFFPEHVNLGKAVKLRTKIKKLMEDAVSRFEKAKEEKANEQN